MNYKKRCEECAFSTEVKGKWCCSELDNLQCELIDNCPCGITIEEVETLEEKAKDVKINLKAKSTKDRKKIHKEIKADTTKENLIQEIAQALKNLDVDNVTIINPTKIIEFSTDNEDFKLDLIRKRKKKK